VNRRVLVAVGAIGVVLVVLELLAVPLATRMIDRALRPCVAYEELELTSVARPVLPGLVVGRVRDVELRATGVRIDDLRVEEVELGVPRAVLPWAVAAGDEPVAGTLRLRLLERDVERALRAALPVAVPVGVSLERDVVSLSAPLLPVTLDLRVEVGPDGTVRLLPTQGGALLDRLGLAPSFRSPADTQVTEIVVDRGEVAGAVALEDVPGFGGGEGCDEPISFSAGRRSGP
jgi:hypothetical protein